MEYNNSLVVYGEIIYQHKSKKIQSFAIIYIWNISIFLTHYCFKPGKIFHYAIKYIYIYAYIIIKHIFTCKNDDT